MAISEALQQLQHPQLLSETKDIIGFDLGHGDTSASRVSATGGDSQKLEAVTGYKVIPTVVGTENELPIVGKRALTDPEVIQPRQQFKSPDISKPEVGRPLRLFVSGVMEGLRNNNSTVLFDSTTLIVFGHPSAWSNEQRLSYGRLIKEQISGPQFMLVPESRAAFLTMREEKQLNQNDIREPILIVDFGSSTTDFTFVHDLRPRELPIGKQYPLGASRIEQQLVQHALSISSHRTKIKTWWKQAPSDYHRTVFKFREAKEDFFKAEDTWRKGRSMEVIGPSYRVSDTSKIRLEVDLDAEAFDVAITTPLRELGDTPISWRDRLCADLEEASRTLHEKYEIQPKIVILTGGAARMAFVEEIAREVFSQSAVRKAPEPEHAISVGLSHAGSIRYRASALLNEIKTLINSGEVRDVIGEQMDGFAKAIAHAVADGFTERFVIPEVMAWRNSGHGTLQDVTIRISTRLERWLKSEDGRRKIFTTLNPWYRQVELKLHGITAPICLKYKIDADSLDLPRSDYEPKRFDIDPELTGLSGLMSAMIATISFVIGTILFGAGTAILLPTGPLAPIIAGALLWILGESVKEKLMRWIPAPTLKSRLRKKSGENEGDLRREIYLSIVGGYEDHYEEDAANKERLARQNREEITERITTGFESALRERAEDASVLIR